MHDTIVYLIANPLLAVGTALLLVLCVYNALRRQVRVVVGLWLLLVVVLFYLHLQIDAQEEVAETDIVAPPQAAR